MRVLFIGGTGNISTAVSRLAIARGVDLYHLNRGQRPHDLDGVKSLAADVRDIDQTQAAVGSVTFDVVVNFIAYSVADIERDIAVFADKTKQYVFISTASVYEKPPTHYLITEETPRVNPFWEYSRKKIAAEDFLLRAWRERGFPATIVRPSLTYDTVIPLPFGAWADYTIIRRMKQGLPVVVHGDGTSLWTITHADDFAVGFLGLLGRKDAIGEAFHITSDEVLTWNQIFQATAAAVGATANLVHIASDDIVEICDRLGYPGVRGGLHGDKSHSMVFDNSKIKRFVPEFRATTTYAAGIQRTLDWFAADPARMQPPEGAKDLNQLILDAWATR